jgi:hypothetical protein
MFCAPGLVFGGTEGIRSRFHVLRDRTSFRRYRGRRVPFSYFALWDKFLAVPRASGPVIKFRASGLLSGGTEGVSSRFHVLRTRTRFLRYRELWVPFSYFALLNSFSAVPRASGPVFKFCPPEVILAVSRASVPVFMFCAPDLIFGGTEGVRSRFYVLRARTHFRRYRGRRVPFSCFALLDLFSAVRRASGPIFMFRVPELIFGGTKGVGSSFHVLRSRDHFWRYRWRRVSISFFALPDTLSAVPRASGLDFIFCSSGLVFGNTEGVGSRFHVLRARTSFRRY